MIGLFAKVIMIEGFSFAFAFAMTLDVFCENSQVRHSEGDRNAGTRFDQQKVN